MSLIRVAFATGFPSSLLVCMTPPSVGVRLNYNLNTGSNGGWKSESKFKPQWLLDKFSSKKRQPVSIAEGPWRKPKVEMVAGVESESKWRAASDKFLQIESGCANPS